jgi:hypothetical protein
LRKRAFLESEKFEIISAQFKELKGNGLPTTDNGPYREALFASATMSREFSAQWRKSNDR